MIFDLDIPLIQRTDTIIRKKIAVVCIINWFVFVTINITLRTKKLCKIKIKKVGTSFSAILSNVSAT